MSKIVSASFGTSVHVVQSAIVRPVAPPASSSRFRTAVRGAAIDSARTASSTAACSALSLCAARRPISGQPRRSPVGRVTASTKGGVLVRPNAGRTNEPSSLRAPLLLNTRNSPIYVPEIAQQKRNKKGAK